MTTYTDKAATMDHGAKGFTTTSGEDLQIRFSGFNGTFKPISLESV